MDKLIIRAPKEEWELALEAAREAMNCRYENNPSCGVVIRTQVSPNIQVAYTYGVQFLKSGTVTVYAQDREKERLRSLA